MRPHTLDEMSTIILIFCRDGANKIELIEKCYLNDIEIHFFPSPLALILLLPTPRTLSSQIPESKYASYSGSHIQMSYLHSPDSSGSYHSSH